MVAKFGSLYDGIKTDSRLAAVYSAVFCLRRFLIVCALLYFRDRSTEIKGYENSSMLKANLLYSYLLIFTLNYIYLVHAKANTESFVNMLEYFNEICMIFIIHVMLFFNTANQLASVVIWDAGIAMMALISFMFFWNFAYLVSGSIKGMIKGAKLAKIRKANLRSMRLNKFKNRRMRGSCRSS